MKRKIILTEDGSSSLFVEELNEHYHSIHGALQESMHIFIQRGLLSEYLQNLETIYILEIGFGTGLNALLTYFSALENHKTIHYTTIEPYPLTSEEVQFLNYTDFIEHPSANSIFEKLHETSWEQIQQINDTFFLYKQKQSALDVPYPYEKFDLVYFDAFAPDAQPELWTEELFKKIYQCMKPESILITYSTKGIVKRALKNVNFQLEKLPGPKGKREILRAKKNI